MLQMIIPVLEYSNSYWLVFRVAHWFMLPPSAYREIRKSQQRLRALRAAQYAQMAVEDEEISTPVRKKRKHNELAESPVQIQSSRQEALSLWRLDQQGSFEVACLKRFSFLREQYDTIQTSLSTPVRKANRFEYKERRYRQGIPLSKVEASRREAERALCLEKEKKRETRRVASKDYKKRMSRTNNWLSPRRCLSALLRVNLCCGPGDSYVDHGVTSGSDATPIFDQSSDSEHPDANVPIFTADDVFSARTRVLESPNVRQWIWDQCNLAAPSFKFGRLFLCESCFCELHNIKVTYSLHIFNYS